MARWKESAGLLHQLSNVCSAILSYLKSMLAARSQSSSRGPTCSAVTLSSHCPMSLSTMPFLRRAMPSMSWELPSGSPSSRLLTSSICMQQKKGPLDNWLRQLVKAAKGRKGVG